MFASKCGEGRRKHERLFLSSVEAFRIGQGWEEVDERILVYSGESMYIKKN
jgi:hypothetical protein